MRDAKRVIVAHRPLSQNAVEVFLVFAPHRRKTRLAAAVLESWRAQP
jgi:hypothetical protein